jgi:hypothetical protein
VAVVSQLSDHLTLPGNVPLGFGNVSSSLLQMVRYRGSVHALLYEQRVTASSRSRAYECRLPLRGAEEGASRRLMASWNRSPRPGLRCLLAPHTCCASPATTSGRRWLRDRSCSRLNKGERSHACSRCYRRKSFSGGVPRTAEFELREMRAATETTIIESRSLMREVDVLLYPPPKGWLRMP